MMIVMESRVNRTFFELGSPPDFGVTLAQSQSHSEACSCFRGEYPPTPWRNQRKHRKQEHQAE